MRKHGYVETVVSLKDDPFIRHCLAICTTQLTLLYKMVQTYNTGQSLGRPRKLGTNIIVIKGTLRTGTPFVQLKLKVMSETPGTFRVEEIN